MYYHPKACLDIINMKDEKVWFVRRIIIELKEMPEFSRYAPYMQYTNEGILFYQPYDELENKTLSIQEFDCNGEYKFSYVIPYPGMVNRFQSYGNYIFLYGERKSDSPQYVRLIKLEDGQIRTIEKINEDLIFPGNSSEQFW